MSRLSASRIRRTSMSAMPISNDARARAETCRADRHHVRNRNIHHPKHLRNKSTTTIRNPLLLRQKRILLVRNVSGC